MREEPAGRAGLSRRGVLHALALVPAALAGCATAGGGRATPAKDAASAAALPPPPASGAALAVRACHLPPDAEPAFVFRAAEARPGEPR